MSDETRGLSPELEQFILEQIDSVPHLEALLLLWRSRPKGWSTDDMAGSLYVPAELAGNILRDLGVKGLIEVRGDSPRTYHYLSTEDHDQLLAHVEAAYRRQLIQLTRLIHTKAPSAVREFARAFKFTKEREKE